MIGRQILHYKILEKLGEGGMGIVYLAEDIKLDRRVAIKFLPRHISADSSERKRFEIEARAAAALNHPNIATIHAIEQSDDDIFIVMEYIPGKELKVRIRDGLKTAECIDFARQIAAGMQAAQDKGIVHRDIKSSNIMITDNGQVKIMDFGLAKMQGGVELTRERSTLGTAAYMSPEQARGEEADHRSDVWSFGVVLYEMLTGKLPFKGNYEQAVIYAILNEEPEFPESPGIEMPENLIAIVHKCLQKDPDQRYQAFKSLIDDLDAKHEPSAPVKTQTKSGVVKKPVFPLKYLIAAAALVLVITGSFIVWDLTGTEHTQGEEPYNSIAVLPLESDEKTEYLSDGITESIINSLSRVPDLRVVPRSIVFPRRVTRPVRITSASV